jgi:hypothetical protein
MRFDRFLENDLWNWLGIPGGSTRGFRTTYSEPRSASAFVSAFLVSLDSDLSEASSDFRDAVDPPPEGERWSVA